MQSTKTTILTLEVLENYYGDVKAFLNHKTEFEFLIAVILSAQTTDKTVNLVTPELFEKFPKAKDLKLASISQIENIIYSVNYHKTKAKHIIETARIIDEEFHNQIPHTIESLIKLPGVGRKVANVILSDFHNSAEGFVVDTHIKRVTYRIGWTLEKTPEKIEKDLIKNIPKKYWNKSPKQLILIGREFCFPKKPNCAKCPLNQFCQKNID